MQLVSAGHLGTKMLSSLTCSKWKRKETTGPTSFISLDIRPGMTLLVTLMTPCTDSGRQGGLQIGNRPGASASTCCSHRQDG